MLCLFVLWLQEEEKKKQRRIQSEDGGGGGVVPADNEKQSDVRVRHAGGATAIVQSRAWLFAKSSFVQTSHFRLNVPGHSTFTNSHGYVRIRSVSTREERVRKQSKMKAMRR